MSQEKDNTRRNFNENLRNLWDKYVLIQDQFLKERSAPIYIDPDTLWFEGNKMTVEVDKSDNDEIVKRIFNERAKIEYQDVTKEYVLINKDVWKKMSESDDLLSIQKELSRNYIEMENSPSINAKILYGGSISENHLTLKEIQQTNKRLQIGDSFVGKVEDMVTYITTLDVDNELFYLYMFGENHYLKNNDTGLNEIKYCDHYISAEDLDKYNNEFGLCFSKYHLIFRIKNSYAELVMKDLCCYYDFHQKAFVFKRRFDNKNEIFEDILGEIQNNIHLFLVEAQHYCSSREIEYHIEFYYYTSYKKTKCHIFNKVSEYVRQHENMKFNVETGILGIDFNWRKENIRTKIDDLEKDIPFVKVKDYGDDHKFKCDIVASICDFSEIKSKLTNRFKNISVTEDPRQHSINIYFPCQNDNYDVQYRYFNETLMGLKLPFEVKIDPLVSGKVHINIHKNEELRVENIKDRLKNLQKVEFGVESGGKVIKFGQLLSVKYPKLVFDIDIESENEDMILEYLKKGTECSLVPILTGDIEKMFRLKNTFSMIIGGKNLPNPNLQKFIFDSSLATPTNDIQDILNQEGRAYNEINRHLINSKINESQKEAILKCIYAKDMAVIQGPPGSGKSTAIAELIWQLIRYGLKEGNKKERILLTSETNLAVDNAVSRIINTKTNLVKPIRLGEKEKLESEGLQFSFELMKKWMEIGDDALLFDKGDEEMEECHKADLALKKWLLNIYNRSFYGLNKECSDIACRWRKILTTPDKRIRNITFKCYVKFCNVIGATCSSIGEKKSDGRGNSQFFRDYKEIFNHDPRKIEFTTVIQDESSKSTLPELALPFVYGDRAIVIGDHRQLPPILDKEEMENAIEYAYYTAQKTDSKNEIIQLKKFLESEFDKIEESHFQRLYENIDSSLKQTFNLQYRMHPYINDVIKQFYQNDGGLNCGLVLPVDLGVNDIDVNNPVSRYHGISVPPFIDPSTHVLLVNTSSPEMLAGTSRVNYGEAETIGKLLDKFEQSDSFHNYLTNFEKEEDKQIGIISFYGKQIRVIRALANQHKNIPIRVSTVDRFQGMERNIVIVSMVRSNVIQDHKDEKPNYSQFPQLGYREQKSLGFAQSPNRLNVALSRAKRLLIILGNKCLFSQLPIYKELFDTIENNQNNKIFKQSEI